MKKPMFSVIVVSLNPGEKLLQTVRSVLGQTFPDYEIVVKDGGSKDGSVHALEEYLARHPLSAPRVRIVRQPDGSIYEGMNQALALAEGEYDYFLNCGDLLASPRALEEAAARIRESLAAGSGSLLFYGDIYDALRGQTVSSNPHMDDFACYRNVPCHQACLYHYSLFRERGYETGYRVRADYEHFLWCYFRKQAAPVYMPLTLASYEGGGYSETRENRRRSRREHREITALYYGPGKRAAYELILLLTLAPLRTAMAESRALSGIYNRLKKALYAKRR